MSVNLNVSWKISFRESVDSLCRDSTDAQYMQYLILALSFIFNALNKHLCFHVFCLTVVKQ